LLETDCRIYQAVSVAYLIKRDIYKWFTGRNYYVRTFIFMVRDLLPIHLNMHWII